VRYRERARYLPLWNLQVPGDVSRLLRREATLNHRRRTLRFTAGRWRRARARGEEHARLNAQILELQNQLAAAHAMSVRAKSLAEMTRTGYVYIISTDCHKLHITADSRRETHPFDHDQDPDAGSRPSRRRKR